MAVRPVAPIPRPRCIDDIGVELFDPFVPEPEPIEDTRTIVFDHHVRLRRQLASHLQATLGLEVQSDAAEVAIGEHEERADSVDEGFGAGPVALPGTAAGRLDLDHVRPHVGQVLARGRTQEKLCERQNAPAGQKPQASCLGPSTSAMMSVSTATRLPSWFLISIFATVRSRSRSMPVIS